MDLVQEQVKNKQQMLVFEKIKYTLLHLICLKCGNISTATVVRSSSLFVCALSGCLIAWLFQGKPMSFQEKHND